MFSFNHYHNEDNEFTKDLEGVFYRQKEGTQGVLIATESDLCVDKIIKMFQEKDFGNRPWCYTENTTCAIGGFISCFMLIHKSMIVFEDKNITFNSECNFAEVFYKFLNEYCNNQGFTYFSVYDAEPFIKRYYETIKKLGYECYCSPIKYVDNFDEKRLDYFMNNDLYKLLFCKDSRFSYQHEFRFAVNNPKKITGDFTVEKGIAFNDLVITNLVYLTREYFSTLKESEL